MDVKFKSKLFRNQHIFVEAEHAYCIYFLVEGSVRTYKEKVKKTK